MNKHLDFVHSSPLHRLDDETDTVGGEAVSPLGDVALELEQQAGQRLGLALHIGEGLFVEFQHALKVADMGLALEEIGVLIETVQGVFGL